MLFRETSRGALVPECQDARCAAVEVSMQRLLIGGERRIVAQTWIHVARADEERIFGPNGSAIQVVGELHKINSQASLPVLREGTSGTAVDAACPRCSCDCA